MPNVHSRSVRRAAFARILILLLASCGCQARKFAASYVNEKNSNTYRSLATLETPSVSSPPSITNAFQSQVRRRTKKDSGPKAPQTKPPKKPPASPAGAPAPSSTEPQNGKPISSKAIGITVASVLVGITFLGAILLMLRRKKVENAEDNKDSSQDFQVRTDTPNNSSLNDLEGSPDDDQSRASSTYWEGTIITLSSGINTLSSDANYQNTVFASDPRVLISESESSFDDDFSLYANDGCDNDTGDQGSTGVTGDLDESLPEGNVEPVMRRATDL
jgi:hypothetical protein